MVQDWIANRYIKWCGRAFSDDDLIQELSYMAPDDDAITDAFEEEIALTAEGMCGLTGAGTNRMNVYTVGRAAQGLANHLQASGRTEEQVLIAFGAQAKAELFAKTSAAVLVSNGIRVFLYEEAMPVRMFQKAVSRAKHIGVMITARKEDPEGYTGFFLFGPDGEKLPEDEALSVASESESLDYFRDIVFGDFEKLLAEEKIVSAADPY